MIALSVSRVLGAIINKFRTWVLKLLQNCLSDMCNVNYMAHPAGDLNNFLNVTMFRMVLSEFSRRSYIYDTIPFFI